MTGHLRIMGDLAELHRIAARQHGTFSIGQVRAAGFDRAAVHRKIARGMWRRLDDAVYGLSSAPPTWRQLVWTAALSRDEALVTHWTACRIFGLSDVPNHRPAILVPRTANTRSKVARIYETDQFARISFTKVDGLRITTMPETILVIARDVEASVVTQVFDEALIRGLLDLEAMSGCIDREAGRRTPGTPLLRRLTSSRRPTAPSQKSTYLEALLEVILHDGRMPRWVREYEFSLDDVLSRVDFYVPSARVVIEADGRNWHGRWEDMESDRRRDNALAARGIVVLRFTYEMLTTQPDRCLREAIDTCLLRAA
ncbi:MAG TPA: type IV toxin-antitoxin system AbiEi family antitoxin domain-containing protein [Acidimicrobiia bacterium]|nr:type IV toxin-antitoxin system AbiEi family antitoxin domain-containing protein [Acidimicrobiia bacterium]